MSCEGGEGGEEGGSGVVVMKKVAVLVNAARSMRIKDKMYGVK